MDASRTGIEGDVVGKNEWHFPFFVEGVDCRKAFQFLSTATQDRFPENESRFLFHGWHQFRSQEVDLVSGGYKHVFVINLEGYRHAGRESPRGRRPDDDGNILSRRS